MSKLYGWAGKILWIDLSERKVVKTPFPREGMRKYIGGRGINSRTLYNELKADVSPFEPENPLIFGVGPCDGTLCPGSGRTTITSLSPLMVVGEDKPGLGDCNVGGFWGPELKYAGYDQVIVKGKSEHPVYIFIDDEDVQIKDASHLWGKTIDVTDRCIKQEIGDSDIHIGCIGPAGENLVRFACIIFDLARAAGRTGMGAVMGSKNLKAIAVRGSGAVKVAKPEKLQQLTKKAAEAISVDMNYPIWSVYGTPGLIELANEYGFLVTRNFQTGVFEGADDIGGWNFVRKYSVKSKACHACPLHCGHYYEIKEGPYKGVSAGGYEFPAANVGSRIGNQDLASMLYAWELYDTLGLDATSTGGVISFAFECYEKGILSSKDTDGLKLSWGNAEAMLELIKKIAYRQGIGDLLAEGSYRAAKKIGKDALKYAIVTKGVEHIEFDPRGVKGWGLAYAVSNRGADHLRALLGGEFGITPEQAKALWGAPEAADRFSIKGKAKMLKWHEDNRAIVDSLEICKFLARTALIAPRWFVDFMDAVTGVRFTEEEIMRVGERINNLERAFNVKQGLTCSDDTLPERFLKEPLPEGPSKGQICELQPMLKEYYQLRGWSNNGAPNGKKLKQLGLSEIADELNL